MKSFYRNILIYQAFIISFVFQIGICHAKNLVIGANQVAFDFENIPSGSGKDYMLNEVSLGLNIKMTKKTHLTPKFIYSKNLGSIRGLNYVNGYGVGLGASFFQSELNSGFLINTNITVTRLLGEGSAIWSRDDIFSGSNGSSISELEENRGTERNFTILRLGTGFGYSWTLMNDTLSLGLRYSLLFLNIESDDPIVYYGEEKKDLKNRSSVGSTFGLFMMLDV